MSDTMAWVVTIYVSFNSIAVFYLCGLINKRLDMQMERQDLHHKWMQLLEKEIRGRE